MKRTKFGSIAITFSIVLASMRWPASASAATLPSLTPNTNTPAVEGIVYALAGGSDGSLYVGGNFTKVGGLARKNLARLTPSGQVDASWQCDANNMVMAMTVVGNELYVAGQFTQIAGQSRTYLASISGGSVTSWNPAPNSTVSSLAASTSAVYASGYFTSIAGASKMHLASFDAQSHALKPFNANLLSTESPAGISLIGATLYLGGTFSSIAGQPRRYAAAVDAETGALTSWHPLGPMFTYQFFKLGSTIVGAGNGLEGIDATTGAILWSTPKGALGVVAKDDILYFGGNTAGAIDGAGKIQPWLGISTGGNSTIRAAAIAGSSLYFGGDFTTFSGQSSPNLARFDFGGPARDSRLPPVLSSPTSSPNANIYTAVGAPDGSLYIGGNFTQINGVTRNYLARLKPDGSLDTTWNPNPDEAISRVVLSGSTLFVIGSFTRIGGQNRTALAALDATSGNALSWAPVIQSRPMSLAADTATVYVSGQFETAGGQSRHHLAAFDRQTGALTAWAPVVSGTTFGGYVVDLAVTDSAVFAGGIFSQMNGQVRVNLAALDKTTGATLTSFTSPLIGAEYCSQIALSGSDLFVAGNSSLYALNPTTGAVKWKNTGGSFSLVAAWNGVVYSGGLSGTANYQAQAFEAATGAPLGWNALLTPINSNGAPLSAIAPTQTALYLVGNMGMANGISSPYIARFPWDGQVTPPPPPPPDSAPSITAQPQNRTVTAGQSATFSITATGTAPLRYQWQKNGTAISNATAATYTLTTTAADDGAQFRCVVTNNAGSATSGWGTLIVGTKPSITTHPLSQTIVSGQPVTFSVAATGSAPLTYQWQRNNVAIAGATDDHYTFTTRATDAGVSFRCIVSNTYGDATSNAATLTLQSPPAITTQPTAKSVLAGQTATFTVVASGTAPLTYQWQKNQINIPGATSNTYTTPVTALGDSGSLFRCVIHNTLGDIQSNEVALTVTATGVAPQITLQPTNTTVSEGDSAVFSIAVNGTEPLTFQWQKNGASISGAVASSYHVVGSAAVQGSVFRCVVTNAFGTATSANATLTVDLAPGVPSDLVAAAGDEQIYLSWSDNSENDLAGYNVYRARGQSGTYVLQNSTLITQTLFSQTGLINGQVYLYKISAVDQQGNESPLSSPASATPIDGAIAVPTLAQPEFESFPTRLHLSDVLRIRTVYTVPVSFEWVFTPESSAPAVPRNGARSSGIGSVTAVPFFSPAAANLATGNYLVSVTAVSGSQRSPAMEGRIALVPDETGVNVFPNPWRADRNDGKDITFEGMSLDSTVKIFTVAGRHVRTLAAPNGEVHWDRKNSAGDWAASGIYIYVISNESGQKKRGKLAIVR